MKHILIAAIAATGLATSFGAVAASAAGHAQNPMVGGAPMLPERNIIENAVNSADHTTLVAAVQAAGLVDTLQGDGPFTVFAPTNAAFAALPDGMVETLLMPENLEQLQRVLTCHVMSGDAMSAAIIAMIDADQGSHPITTVGGCQFTLMTDANNNIMIRDGQGRIAHVTIADVAQSNGVIHVIDSVLLPAM